MAESFSLGFSFSQGFMNAFAESGNSFNMEKKGKHQNNLINGLFKTLVVKWENVSAEI